MSILEVLATTELFMYSPAEVVFASSVLDVCLTSSVVGILSEALASHEVTPEVRDARPLLGALG